MAAATDNDAWYHLVNRGRELEPVFFTMATVAWAKVKDKIEVSNFYLTGYSLGATQAAFVAKLDDTEHAFDFKKALWQ